MGNSVVRQTVFRKSWWAKECRRDFGDVKTVVQPPEELHRAVVEVSSDGGGDGLDMTVGLEVVGNYYNTWYNAPEDVWRYYADDAEYSYVGFDGTRNAARGRAQIRELLENLAAPETGNIEDDDSDYRSMVVQSVQTVRCPSGQWLIMATTETFVQSFLVRSTEAGSFAVTASVLIVKRAVAESQQTQQTPQTPQSPPPSPTRVDDRRSDQTSVYDTHLFVGYLTASVKKEHLIKTFTRYGRISKVRINSGVGRDGKPTVYAFVIFESAEAVDAALTDQPIVLCNGDSVKVRRSAKSRR